VPVIEHGRFLAPARQHGELSRALAAPRGGTPFARCRRPWRQATRSR